MARIVIALGGNALGNTPAERFYEKNDFRPDGWTSVVLRLD